MYRNVNHSGYRAVFCVVIIDRLVGPFLSSPEQVLLIVGTFRTAKYHYVHLSDSIPPNDSQGSVE